jgi:hypothetical protein
MRGVCWPRKGDVRFWPKADLALTRLDVGFGPEAEVEHWLMARAPLGFRQRLRDFARTIDEELRHWTERPVLQGDDSHRSQSRLNGQLDRQDLERQSLATEPQHGPRKYPEIPSRRDQAGMQLGRHRHHRRPWRIIQAFSTEGPLECHPGTRPAVDTTAHRQARRVRSCDDGPICFVHQPPRSPVL